MADNYELFIAPERPTRNPLNGRYLKGNVPFNKGKKWSEWASKECQERMKMGWKNISIPHPRPDVTKRLSKPVIAIVRGKAKYFASITIASLWCGGGKPGITRCCKLNQNPLPNNKNGRLNTDNTYMGYRWYYESDEQWILKTTK